jgi:hypothetical protein
MPRQLAELEGPRVKAALHFMFSNTEIFILISLPRKTRPNFLVKSGLHHDSKVSALHPMNSIHQHDGQVSGDSEMRFFGIGRRCIYALYSYGFVGFMTWSLLRECTMGLSPNMDRPCHSRYISAGSVLSMPDFQISIATKAGGWNQLA